MKIKPNTIFWTLSATLAGSLLVGTTANAQTDMAHLDFNAGPAGSQVAHLSGSDGVFSADVPDISGNGNAFSVWGLGGNGETYRSSVPASTIPRTGAANSFSVQNSGSGPGMWSASTALKNWSPTAWTIEASFKAENGNYRTIVGRDSRGAYAGNTDLAALYLQCLPNNAIGIKFVDVAGAWHEAISADNVFQSFDWPSDNTGSSVPWYNLAAVSDGSLLSLYMDSGAGYALIASTPLVSGNTALSAGTGDGGDWDAGNFTVMRGLYAGNHTDRLFGLVDEVRISDGALAVSDFLFSPVPEPGTISLAAMGLVGLVAARRRMARK